MMAESPEEEGKIVLWLEKAHWARKPPGMELEISVKNGVPTVVWHGETWHTTSALMSEEASAGAWLFSVLAEGPMHVTTLEERTKNHECEHSWASVRRAKSGMAQVVHRQHPDDRKSYWMPNGTQFPFRPYTIV